jgi:ADP-glucose pyrophosphorylase
VRVQEQVAVAESVILRGSHIGRNCSLFGCVIAENTTIRPDTYWQHVAADQQHLTRVARRKEAPIPPGFPAGREWRRERVAQADPLSSTAPLPGG